MSSPSSEMSSRSGGGGRNLVAGGICGRTGGRTCGGGGNESITRSVGVDSLGCLRGYKFTYELLKKSINLQNIGP